MPRGGHNRLPESLKRERGTAKKSRTNPKAPRLELTPVPPPPPDLSRHERLMWMELAPQIDALRIYTASSETALRALVAALALVRFRAGSERERLRAWTTVLAMLARFGLDPASRDRVAVVAQDDSPGDEKVPIYGIRGVIGGGGSNA